MTGGEPAGGPVERTRGRAGHALEAALRWLFLLTLGTLAGLGTALWSVSGQPPLGAVGQGPWRAWPAAGGPDADPYARAVLMRDGRLPLPPAVGLRFLASTDSEGRPLEARCDYRVAGPPPAADHWTLTLLDRTGFPAAGETERAGFTSSELLRAQDGSAIIVVAPAARAGNWLPAPQKGSFQLMLSVYGTPPGTALHRGEAAGPLPSIERKPCP